MKYLPFLLLLAGCQHFPLISPHKLVIAKGACGEYKQVRQNPPQFEFIKWHPIEKCEGYFAVSPEDIAAMRRWCDMYPNECNKR